MYNNSDSNRPPRPKKDVCPTPIPNVGRLTEATILLPRLAGQRPALQSIYSNKERYWTFPKNHSIRSRFYRLLGWIALGMTAFCAHASQQDSEMLVAAIEKGELQWVQERVAKENIDAILSNAMTALHVATYHGQLAGAQYLLDTGADPNIANRYGVTPLMLARANGDNTFVSLLLKAGADPNKISPEGETPLMLAARAGKLDCIESLLEQGADPNATESWEGQTALMWAAAEGHAPVARRLLDAGADVNSKSKAGLNAFQYATRQGKIDVVRTFLQSRTDSPINSLQIDNALYLAVRNAHYELAAQLLESGANPNVFNKGYNALHAITWIRRPGKGTNRPAPPGSGNLKSLDFVRLLVEKGIDIDARMTERRAGVRTAMDFDGATAFLLASRTADTAMMRLLLELGADPRIPNTSGTTPLLAAAGVGVQSPKEDPGSPEEVYKAVTIALEAGGDVNKVNRKGESVMHGAAYKFAASTIPLLASHGANMDVWNTKNKLGWTPLRIAVGVHRGMNLRSSPEAEKEIRKLMEKAGVSTYVEPETNISGATK
jgi:ankyrin repeat protein